MTMTTHERTLIIDGLSTLAEVCYRNSKEAGWWHDLETGEPLNRNKGEMLALIHSEVSECLEAERKDKMDDKLPHRHGRAVEMADAFIRGADYVGGWDFIEEFVLSVVEKIEFNAQRADHKPENRRGANGKKF